jgi:type I restriction enzyme M protein
VALERRLPDPWPLDAPKFKDYILPLIFLKRLLDVFDDELDHLAEQFGERRVDDQYQEACRSQPMPADGYPQIARWTKLACQPSASPDAVSSPWQP